MNQEVPEGRRNRYELFKTAVEMGMSAGELLEYTEPMRDKSEEEIEAMAAEAVKKLKYKAEFNSHP